MIFFKAHLLCSRDSLAQADTVSVDMDQLAALVIVIVQPMRARFCGFAPLAARGARRADAAIVTGAT
jgi:hypothetical protein